MCGRRDGARGGDRRCDTSRRGEARHALGGRMVQISARARRDVPRRGHRRVARVLFHGARRRGPRQPGDRRGSRREGLVRARLRTSAVPHAGSGPDRGERVHGRRRGDLRGARDRGEWPSSRSEPPRLPHPHEPRCPGDRRADRRVERPRKGRTARRKQARGRSTRASPPSRTRSTTRSACASIASRSRPRASSARFGSCGAVEKIREGSIRRYSLFRRSRFTDRAPYKKRSRCSVASEPRDADRGRDGRAPEHEARSRGAARPHRARRDRASQGRASRRGASSASARPHRSTCSGAIGPWRSIAPALAEAARAVGGPHHRRMGTLGGNLCLDTRCRFYDQSAFWRGALGFCLKKDGNQCHVVPGGQRCVAAASNDTAAAAIALEASVVLAGPAGERSVSLRDFYTANGLANTVRAPGEILLGSPCRSVVAVGARTRSYDERAAIDFPLLSVAVRADVGRRRGRRFGRGRLRARRAAAHGRTGGGPPSDARPRAWDARGDRGRPRGRSAGRWRTSTRRWSGAARWSRCSCDARSRGFSRLGKSKATEPVRTPSCSSCFARCSRARRALPPPRGSRRDERPPRTSVRRTPGDAAARRHGPPPQRGERRRATRESSSSVGRAFAGAFGGSGAAGTGGGAGGSGAGAGGGGAAGNATTGATSARGSSTSGTSSPSAWASAATTGAGATESTWKTRSASSGFGRCPFSSVRPAARRRRLSGRGPTARDEALRARRGAVRPGS